MCFLKSFVLLFIIVINAKALVIYQDGKFLKSYSRSEFLNIGESKKIKFYNYNNNKSTTYLGIEIDYILKNLNIDSNEIEEVVFNCLNGYQPYLNYQLFKNRKAYLTYKTAGAKPFTRFSQKTKKIVDLGPYYLVWKLDDLHQKYRFKYSSIYKIQAIDFKTKLFKLPFNKNTNLDGFKTYKRYCLSCHKINNNGGSLSSELLDSKYLKSEVDFTRYVANPNSVNPNSEMLPFPNFANKNYKIKNIFSMLTLLKQARNKTNLNENDIKDLNKLIKEFSAPEFGKPLELDDIN